MNFYVSGTANILTPTDHAYVVRDDGVTYLKTHPVQPGQCVFRLMVGERVYNDPRR
jgi:hypothetical protein